MSEEKNFIDLHRQEFEKGYVQVYTGERVELEATDGGYELEVGGDEQFLESSSASLSSPANTVKSWRLSASRILSRRASSAGAAG